MANTRPDLKHLRILGYVDPRGYARSNFFACGAKRLSIGLARSGDCSRIS
jgi:hypothetical protein